MRKIREYLEKMGIPGSDLYELPTSPKKFVDGAEYRIECVLGGRSIPEVEQMRAFFEGAEEHNVIINRISETQGIMLHSDRELEQMIELAKEEKAELILSPGIRAEYDTSAVASLPSKIAGRIANRLRGTENLVRAIADVRRAVDLGGRGIIVYDEGMLWVLGRMRKDGLLPSDLQFKVSAHCGHGNPASIKLLADLADNKGISINPTRDLELPMIAALRKATDVVLDIHIDVWPPDYGNWIRTYEAPEIVRVGAPVNLKCGFVRFGTGIESIKSGAKQASLVQQMVERLYPEAKQSKPGAKGMAIPK